MDEHLKELSDHRLERAARNLDVSEKVLADGYYNFAINRAYYAVFEAMRAVNTIDGFDSSKHSGVIAHFNQYHVKTGEFDRDTSTIIRRASTLREKSDYEDFFEADKADAQTVLQEARDFIARVRVFLSTQ